MIGLVGDVCLGLCGCCALWMTGRVIPDLKVCGEDLLFSIGVIVFLYIYVAYVECKISYHCHCGVRIISIIESILWSILRFFNASRRKKDNHCRPRHEAVQNGISPLILHHPKRLCKISCCKILEAQMQDIVCPQPGIYASKQTPSN